MIALVYYVAASLDGYIAPPDGSIDWLSPFESGSEGEEKSDHGYAAFYGTVDSIILGRRTYEQVLGFGPWPYADRPCWVCTRGSGVEALPGVTLTAAPPHEVMAEVARRGGLRAWMVGGGRTASAFAAAGLVTELIVSVIPVLLGGGTLLFDPPAPRAALRLQGHHDLGDGIVQLRYALATRPGA